MNKKEYLAQAIRILKDPKVVAWYDENLKGDRQINTIETLEKGIIWKKITLKEGLTIALIVGVQWNVKFPGTR